MQTTSLPSQAPMTAQQIAPIRHTVMWRFHEFAHGADKASNLAQAQELLQACAQLVPGIRTFEVQAAVVGMDCTHDLALHMLVDDANVLAQYRNHPQHRALKPFMKAVVQERCCMDYEVPNWFRFFNTPTGDNT
jgi:Stress responsive A/B Barrel Domain